jgi:hypothetical protein
MQPSKLLSFFLGVVSCYFWNLKYTTLPVIVDLFDSAHISRELNVEGPPSTASHPAHLRVNHHRKLFFDFGANDGDSIMHFMKPENESQTNAEYNADLKGMGLSRDWDIIAFEANPCYTPQLERVKSKLLSEKMVKSFSLYDGTAVATTEGNITFHLDGSDGPGAAGSSLMGNSKSVIPHKRTITVRSIDIEFLITHKYHIKKEDFVVMKIDIEGILLCISLCRSS